MILFDSVDGLFDDQIGDFDDGGVVSPSVTLTGQSATSAIGSVSAAGVQSPTETITGLSATSAIGEVVASGQSFAVASVTGIEVTSSLGSVSASATGDGIATVSGVAATSSIANLSFDVEIVRKGRKTNAKFLEFNPRPIQAAIGGKAEVIGVSGQSSIETVSASATVSGLASVVDLQAQTDIQGLKAGGIINPTDDEIIWLLAA